MNLVFITRSGERAANWKREPLDLLPIAAFVIAAASGGAAVAYALSGLGGTIRGLDPSDHHFAYFALLTVVSVPLIALQSRGKMGHLPERHEQVPRRWLTWKRRSWTAAAYGTILGAGFFTHLRYPSMYVLALAVLVAPSSTLAAFGGAIYGLSRGSIVLYAWWSRHLSPSLPRPATRSIVLAATASLVPAWIVLVAL